MDVCSCDRWHHLVVGLLPPNWAQQALTQQWCSPVQPLVQVLCFLYLLVSTIALQYMPVCVCVCVDLTL